jgi:hypothetical protein
LTLLAKLAGLLVAITAVGWSLFDSGRKLFGHGPTEPLWLQAVSFAVVLFAVACAIRECVR